MNNNKLKSEIETQDPFSPLADPCPPMDRDWRAPGVAPQMAETPQHVCECGTGRSVFSRRQALLGLSLMASAPAFAKANPTLVPCYPEQQKPEACHHKYCKYYAGHDDYYGR